MKHIVLYSGGLSSHFAAKRVIEQHGKNNVVLLFTDTKVEDPDLYRFLREGSESLGVPITWLEDGRTIWQVFKDENFLGNSRADPCSRVLKRFQSARFVKRYDPESTVVHLGFGWDEGDRLSKAKRYWFPYQVIAPMMEKPYLSNKDLIELVHADGIRHPRLYDFGLPHNNCGGGCVKAGIGHFLHLLNVLPDVFAEWEKNEQDVINHIGKNVAMLTRTRGKKKKPFPLYKLRATKEFSESERCDIGGCGCFTPANNSELLSTIFGKFILG